MSSTISKIRIPDSAICIAAMELAREASPDFLFNHVMRSFAFGHELGQKSGHQYDVEMLFIGSALHDLGLVDAYIKKDRFEIDGADAAADFLSRRGYPDAKIAVIWDAIALHSTLAIPQRKQPEIALVQVGAGVDIGAVPMDGLTGQTVSQILEEYPRLGFKEAILLALSVVAEKKPMTGIVNLIGEVGRDCVHGFHIPSFPDIVRGAAFDE